MRPRYVPALLAAVASALLASSEGAHAESELVQKAVEYRQGDAVLEGWIAYDPALKGKRPGVLVFHAWKGLDGHSKNSAERLARQGYVAFCADVYGKGVRPRTSEEAGAEAKKYKTDRALTRQRAKAALDRLLTEPSVDPARVGAIGYCFGGMVALELARSGAEVAAVVSFHGSLDTPNRDDAKGAKARVLVLHGADDPFVPPDQVTAFQEEMRAAKRDWSLVQYGGAVHSFSDPEAGNDPSRGAAYDEKAAKRSWEAMSDWFREAFEPAR